MTDKELIALLKKNPIGVGCGVLAIALGAALYFRSDGLPAASAKLDQVSAEGQRLTANIKNAAQLHEQLAALAAADQEVEPRIVHAGELAKNLQYFYKIEAETGTKLTDLHQNAMMPATAKGPAKTTYSGISFSVTVEGEYTALLDFLRRLENGSHYCRVLTATMSLSGNEVDRTGPLRLIITLELLGQS